MLAGKVEIVADANANEDLTVFVKICQCFCEVVEVGFRDIRAARDIAELQKRCDRVDDIGFHIIHDSREIYFHQGL